MSTLLTQHRRSIEGESSMEQWRWRLENRGGEQNDGDGVSAFKGRPGSKRKPRHGLLLTSVMPKTAPHAPGSRKKLVGGHSCPMVLFLKIIKLSLSLKHKLLLNLCNNSKISKNKSCSKFKVLQLYFYNDPLIQSTF